MCACVGASKGSVHEDLAERSLTAPFSPCGIYIVVVVGRDGAHTNTRIQSAKYEIAISA